MISRSCDQVVAALGKGLDQLRDAGGSRSASRRNASADLFLFCSRTDTYGQVITEAQASGLPVVAVREGGPVSLIRDRHSGWLVEPDADEIASAVAQLAASPFLRERLSRSALAASAAAPGRRSSSSSRPDTTV